ncbi:MAG: hypothetical protein J0L84_19780 [Verrucomicrobia bacterium]|nr:hypothetical protein [Verrucomicrobiota bacterium]
MRRVLIRGTLGLFLATAVVAVGLRWTRRLPPSRPAPDGYEQLVTLGQGVFDEDWRLSENGAARAVFGLRHPLLVQETREALRHPMEAFPATSDTELDKLRQVMALKRLGNSLGHLADNAAWTNDCRTALEIHLVRVELGLGAVRGGVLIDFMVGTAIESGGLTGIARLTNCPGPIRAGPALTALRRLLATEEPMAAVLSRERRWMWLESGWWRSAEQLRDHAADIFRNPRDHTRKREHLMARQRRDALLVLARMAYTADHGVPPKRNEDLVPGYLAVVPADPGPAPASAWPW